MKDIILLPAFIFCLAAGLCAADDCSKSADACRPQIKKITPFMAGITKAQKPLEMKQGAARVATLKQGEPKARLVAASTVPAAATAGPRFESRFGPAAAEPPAKKEALSKPAWLLAVGALLAGLYYFLKEGKTKRKHS